MCKYHTTPIPHHPIRPYHSKHQAPQVHITSNITSIARLLAARATALPRPALLRVQYSPTHQGFPVDHKRPGGGSQTSAQRPAAPSRSRAPLCGGGHTGTQRDTQREVEHRPVREDAMSFYLTLHNKGAVLKGKQAVHENRKAVQTSNKAVPNNNNHSSSQPVSRPTVPAGVVHDNIVQAADTVCVVVTLCVCCWVAYTCMYMYMLLMLDLTTYNILTHMCTSTPHSWSCVPIEWLPPVWT